jgi:hypothetical protein
MDQTIINAVAAELERRGIEGVSNDGEPSEDEVGPNSGLRVFNVDIRTHMKYLVGVAWADGEPSLTFGSDVPADSDDVEGIADWIETICDYLDTDDYHEAILSGSTESTYRAPPYVAPEKRKSAKGTP